MPDVCRIFAGVSGSPGSVHALRQAADLTRRNDAILIPLHTWVPPEGDFHERRHPCQELRQLWEEDAWQRLWEALDTAFGGLPAGAPAQPVVLRGKPGKVLTGVVRQAGDLLVISVGRRGHCSGCGPVLDTSPPANKPAVVSPMGGRRTRTTASHSCTSSLP